MSRNRTIIACWAPMAAAVAAATVTSYITHRDVRFEGTDAVLAAELTRRMAGPKPDQGPPDKALLEDIQLELNVPESWDSMPPAGRVPPTLPPPPRATSLNSSVRKLGTSWGSWWAPPPDILPSIPLRMPVETAVKQRVKASASASAVRAEETTRPAMTGGDTTTAKPDDTTTYLSETMSPSSMTTTSGADSPEWVVKEVPYYYNKLRMDPLDPEIEEVTMRLMEQSCFTIQYRLKDVEYIINKYEGNPRYRLAFAFRKLEDWERDITTMYSYVRHHHEEGTGWYAGWWNSDPNWYQFQTLPTYATYYSHSLRKLFNILYTREYIVALNTQIVELVEEEKIRLEYKEYLSGLNTTNATAANAFTPGYGGGGAGGAG